jgi:hypothetical protein
MMHIRNLVLFAFLSISGAFIVPDGTEDGVYEHHIDANGVGVHVKIANATDYSSTSVAPYIDADVEQAKPSRIKRVFDVQCGDGHSKHNLHQGVSVLRSV